MTVVCRGSDACLPGMAIGRGRTERHRSWIEKVTLIGLCLDVADECGYEVHDELILTRRIVWCPQVCLKEDLCGGMIGDIANMKGEQEGLDRIHLFLESKNIFITNSEIRLA
jgi:hypothetical protein